MIRIFKQVYTSTSLSIIKTYDKDSNMSIEIRYWQNIIILIIIKK